MIVVDAAVVVEVLVAGLGPATDRLESEDLHAPHLVDAEVLHVLRCRARRGELDPELADAAVDALGLIAVRRHPHVILRARVWQLRQNLTAYDAHYVALAERLGAPLVTGDARIAACPGLRVSVEVVGSA